MIGVNGALALGLHLRHGWKICAIAGVSAASPDWDGLTLLYSASLYDASHRVWGHNLFACLLGGMLLGQLDYRLDFVTRVGRRFVRAARFEIPATALNLRSHYPRQGLIVWMFTSTAAAISHLPADVFVSGHADYGNWAVQLLWPLSNRGWVDPRIPWGDVGVTLIFIAGTAAMVGRPHRLRWCAAGTLLAVATYVVVRPWLAIEFR